MEAKLNKTIGYVVSIRHIYRDDRYMDDEENIFFKSYDKALKKYKEESSKKNDKYGTRCEVTFYQEYINEKDINSVEENIGCSIDKYLNGLEDGIKWEEVDERIRYTTDHQELDRTELHNKKISGIVVYYRHYQYLNYAYEITDVEEVKNLDIYSLKPEARYTYEETCTVFDDIDQLETSFRYGYSIFSKIRDGAYMIRDFINNYKKENHETE